MTELNEIRLKLYVRRSMWVQVNIYKKEIIIIIIKWQVDVTGEGSPKWSCGLSLSMS
jgi:hypothetical protein